MSFHPDIVVYRPDSNELALAAEVKSPRRNPAEFDHEIARYMLGMNCPVVLVVTPGDLTLYHDRFLSRDESSIEMLGPIPSDQFSAFQRFMETTGHANLDTIGALFDDAVRKWLRSLASNGIVRGDESHATPAVAEYVVPAVAGGDVRAAAPREWRVG